MRESYRTRCRQITGRVFSFVADEGDVRIWARGSWLRHWTTITAVAPWCAGVELAIGDGARDEKSRLTPPDHETRLGALRVLRDPEGLAGVWLERETCDALGLVDEYARYDFKLKRGRVEAFMAALEHDGERLQRAIVAAINLARRGQQLRDVWSQLCARLEGRQSRPERWRLTSASPIAAVRNLTALRIDTDVPSTRVCRSHGLHTRISVAGVLRAGEPSADDELCAVRRRRGGTEFYLPGFVTDDVALGRAMDRVVALCQPGEASPVGPYR